MPSILNETTLISVNYFDYEMQTAGGTRKRKQDMGRNVTHKNFTYKLHYEERESARQRTFHRILLSGSAKRHISIEKEWRAPSP